MKPCVSGYKLKWLKWVTWGFFLLQGKADTFVPGGASLHNCMTPHGVDTATYEVLLSHNIVKLSFHC
jgi:homogentisate 1,2-dioxygenase